jgi:triphosphoribosyl-dephospho-CoA synthase
VTGAPPDADPRTAAENAQLALLLEVAGTPKPGNVDRHRDLDSLRFEHFLAGAVGAGRGLRRAADDDPVGASFETAVRGMARQSGGNTQFGCLLLLVPLVVAATNAADAPARDDARAVVEATTVADAAGFYRAFEHVDVAVDDPPADATDLDVRRGSDAVPALEARELTLLDVMALSADRDANAREWVEGFPRVFEAADGILAAEGSVLDRAAHAFLDLLADAPDTLVAIQHGEETAEQVRQTAAALVAEDAPRPAVEAFADDLVDRGINPGTTADLTSAALFVALERGVTV